MAKRSKWQQFADNFDAMNSTMNKGFSAYEINKLKKQDFFEDEMDDDGNVIGQKQLEGDALRMKQSSGIADIYDKYGMTDQASKMRVDSATLKGLQDTNSFNDLTVEDRAKKLRLENSKAETDQRLAGLQADAAEVTANDRKEVARITADAGKQEFGSQKEENAWLIDAFKNSGLSPKERTNSLKSIREFGAEAIAVEADRITQGATAAMREGLPGLTNYYNSQIADGQNLQIDEGEDGSMVAFLQSGTGENIKRTEIARGEGEDAGMQLQNSLFGMISDPSDVMGAAVKNLAYRQSRANLDKTQTDTKQGKKNIELTDSRIGEIAANVDLKEAQVQQIASSIKVDDARTLQIVAETTKAGVAIDKIQAEIKNINGQTANLGLKGQLDQAQVANLAAKTAQIKFNMDPDRPLTRSEADKEWASYMAKLMAMGYEDPAMISQMQPVFYQSLGFQTGTQRGLSGDQPANNSGFTIKLKED
jgi:hypothetical protein